jgi:hypothetical protein
MSRRDCATCLTALDGTPRPSDVERRDLGRDGKTIWSPPLLLSMFFETVRSDPAVPSGPATIRSGLCAHRANRLSSTVSRHCPAGHDLRAEITGGANRNGGWRAQVDLAVGVTQLRAAVVETLAASGRLPCARITQQIQPPGCAIVVDYQMTIHRAIFTSRYRRVGRCGRAVGKWVALGLSVRARSSSFSNIALTLTR